ncbi:MAG TPA: hypothetical protein VFN81_01100 [Sphingomicrobium sp.]|nr:hypothetical protein [Sphingomicrobium sp.]
MILRRLTENLRLQNWTTIAIELVIVIIGVFIGNSVNDWSQQRAADRETNELLVELRPEMIRQRQSMESIRNYLQITGRYADVAFAGWRRDPKVSDAQFVIAAYQASQSYGLSANGQTWAEIFGGDQLRRIKDSAIRTPLQRLMTYDYSLLSYDRLNSKYRNDVRLIIPNDIQRQIRAACGDHLILDGKGLGLPPTCPINIPNADGAATGLRAHPELVGELAQHESLISTQFTNVDLVESQIDELDRAIAHLR